MSIKQNKNIYYANLAFEQAKINLGSTGRNPSVGCIVLKNDSIISSGHTSLNGRPHAEYNALNRNLNYKNSTIYISMEPCVHYGVTPPCTNKIIQKKIKKVFFSITDLDIRSANKAKKILKRKKIKVFTNLNNKYAKDFYKSYFLNHKSGLPLIDAKIAISKDYFTINKRKKWITNEHSRKRVHLLRTNYDCIVSTSKSINDDNSELNCRLDGLKIKSPKVIIIDRFLKIKKNKKIFNSKKQIYIFTEKYVKSKYIFLKKKGVKIVKLNSMNKKDDYRNIFLKLKKKGNSRILVESGLTFLNFLLKIKLINNLYVFKSNINLNKEGFNYSNNSFLKKINLKKKIKVNLLGDNLYKVKLK